MQKKNDNINYYENEILKALHNHKVIDSNLYGKCNYQTRIRQLLRDITDNKEEYESLRDSILGAYEERDKGKTYYGTTVSKFNSTIWAGKDSKVGDNVKSKGEISQDMIDKASENDLIYNEPHFFSLGHTQDEVNKSCFFDDSDIQNSARYKSKFVWSLGKDGLMISKALPPQFTQGDAHNRNLKEARNARGKAIWFNGTTSLLRKWESDNPQDVQMLKQKYPEVSRGNITEENIGEYHKYQEEKSNLINKYLTKNTSEFADIFINECNRNIDSNVYQVFYVRSGTQ